MKKKTVKALLCAALMAVTLSATACGGSDAGNDSAAPAEEASVEDEAPAEEEDAADEEVPADEEAPAEEEVSEDEEAPAEEEVSEDEEASAEEEASDENLTLEDYMNATPGAMEAFEEQVAGANQEGMSITAEVKGNDFIFNYTFTDASVITDDMPAQLEAGLEATASIFEAMAGQMDEAMGQEGAVAMVVRYFDPDGNVLAERSFKAE